MSKRIACFCPLPAARIAAKRSEFLVKEFCTNLLFYFGVWVSSYFKTSSWTVWFDVRSNLAWKLTLIVKFQESGRRRTTLWMCYLQNIIYVLLIYLINVEKHLFNLISETQKTSSLDRNNYFA